MKSSISNSISIVQPIWRPFVDRLGNANPYIKYSRQFNTLGSSVEILSEIYPPYATGWIRVELEVEKYFQLKLDNWNNEKANGKIYDLEDVVEEIKMHKAYLNKTFNVLLLNNIKMKKLLKRKVMQFIELEGFLDIMKI